MPRSHANLMPMSHANLMPVVRGQTAACSGVKQLQAHTHLIRLHPFPLPTCPLNRPATFTHLSSRHRPRFWCRRCRSGATAASGPMKRHSGKAPGLSGSRTTCTKEGPTTNLLKVGFRVSYNPGRALLTLRKTQKPRQKARGTACVQGHAFMSEDSCSLWQSKCPRL